MRSTILWAAWLAAPLHDSGVVGLSRMRRLRIFGAGVSAAIVADLVKWQFDTDYVLEGFYDDSRPPGSKGPLGLPIFGTVSKGVEDIRLDSVEPFIAFGTSARTAACRLLLRLRDLGLEPPALLAPGAHISPSARIGANSVVYPGVFIGAGTIVGDLFTAHALSVVEHDCKVGVDVVIGPGAAIAGFCSISSHGFVGVGACMLPNSTMGVGSLLGAGSVLVGALPANMVATGCPARVIRKSRDGEEVPTAAEIADLNSGGFPS